MSPDGSPAQVKAEVDTALEEAKKSEEPSTKNLWEHTYVDGLGAMFRPLTMDKPKIPV
jgi:TPP-dependent pyruvate/acetoin dehydrogenase alpha subunit